jgi:hypothetical protein
MPPPLQEQQAVLAHLLPPLLALQLLALALLAVQPLAV